MADGKMLERNVPGLNRRRNFGEIEKAAQPGKTLLRLFRYLTVEKRMIGGMLVIVLVGTISGVLAPGLQSNAIDIVAQEREGNLISVLLLMGAIYLLYSGCSLLQGVCSAHLSQRVVKRMREQLFGKLEEVPIRYLDLHSHGDLMSRMTNDIENISNTISQSLISLAAGVLTILGTTVMMVWYCWQLALISCSTVFLTVFATKIISGKMRFYSRKRQSCLGTLNGTVEESVSGYKTVMAYQHQEETIREFEEISDEMTRVGVIADALGGVMGPIMNSINNIGFVIIAAFGGYFALNGMISVGVISAFIVYARQFGRPINEIAQVYGQLQTAIAGAERVFSVLDEEGEDRSGCESLQNAEGVVSFEHVNFSYEPEKQVLKDFSLIIEKGKKVALVGATGSGKTTVVNLLMRFYPVDSGRICIDGKDIRKIPLDELRKAIAIVLQDTVLFSDTIRNNLLYSNAEATDEQLQTAIAISNSQELMRHLPRGLDTVLTGSGEELSQGQRQLLAIARAFVANPKILILDEATSNVDTRTEKNIQDAMLEIMKNRTSIIIAHRLSTIQDADEIIVMDQGRIVEHGSHTSLLEQKGRYYELYMTQFAGFGI